MMLPISDVAAFHPAPRKMREDIIIAAQAFEAMVISQMLQASGMNKPLDGFGGGTGEEQFSSFLTDSHAQALAARGGIGLAERLIRAMPTAESI
jgi:Rod binding domain-containing protein